MLSVTEVLWKIFPYNNEFFLKSLSKKWMDQKRITWKLMRGWIADIAWYINYDRLMNNLTSFWSNIHLYAYMLWTWLWKLELPKFYCDYLSWLNNFFRRYNVRTILWEHYIRTDKYCWTFDALISMTLPWASSPVNVLIDYKTWKYYKDFYWIENRILKKDGSPYFDKWSLQKVRLQLSLYRDWLRFDDKYKDIKVDHLWVVRITKKWTFFELLDYDITEYTNWLANPSKTATSKTVWRI